jgi:ATP-dependent 26S proteasome regulatory subunit
VTDTLPRWAADIKEKYEADVASIFLLHTNVFDLYPLGGGYVPLREFLTKALAGAPDTLAVYYNIAEGFVFPDEDARRRFLTFYAVAGSLAVDLDPDPRVWEKEQAALRDPRRALPLLGRLLTSRNNVSLIIDHVEKIAPAGEMSHLLPDDRRNVATLQRWGFDPGFRRRNNFVMLIAEHQSAVHSDLWRGNAALDSVPIPYPNDEERRAFIDFRLRETPGGPDVDAARLTRLTAGLSATKIDGVFKVARRAGRGVSLEEVVARKNEMIRDEFGGLIQVAEPSHGLDAVAGQDAAKAELLAVIEAFRRGDRATSPMGIGLIGPPGTGKTFIGKAIAKELGLPVVEIGNLRAEYVGQSERNSEKVINFLSSMGSVAVLYDEFDQAFGQRSERGDSGVSARLWGMWSRFLGDSAHRGRLLVIWMTNRPDLVDEALKRPGRLGDLKIPLYHAAADPIGMLRSVAKRAGLELEADLEILRAPLTGFSAAEIEMFVTIGRRAAAAAGVAAAAALDAAMLRDALARMRPSRNSGVVEYMEVLASLEATYADFVLPPYDVMSRAELEARATELRGRLAIMGLL